MRIFIRLLILFSLAAGLAIGARFNPGNVVLFYPPYRVDLSLNFFLFLALLCFLIFYYVIRAMMVTVEMPRNVAQYRQNRRERESNNALREALKALFEGRFGHAEKSALRALDLLENKGIAALIGARSAHHMGQFERRNAWFARIEDDIPLKTARLVTMTELFVDEHKSEQALEAVKELNARGKRHIQVLRWALKANQQAKKWEEVLKLVRVLDKHHALHPALSMRLRELSYEALLKDHQHDGESLRRVWNEIPSAERKNRFVAYTAASAFVGCQLFDDARNIVQKTLPEDWDDRLLRIYREASAAEGSATLRSQIEHCESWLTMHPKNAELSLCLGVLCFNQKLWGKAQVHLENALYNSVELRSVRESNVRLAQLHETLGNDELASNYFKQAAIIAL